MVAIPLLPPQPPPAQVWQRRLSKLAARAAVAGVAELPDDGTEGHLVSIDSGARCLRVQADATQDNVASIPLLLAEVGHAPVERRGGHVLAVVPRIEGEEADQPENVGLWLLYLNSDAGGLLAVLDVLSSLGAVRSGRRGAEGGLHDSYVLAQKALGAGGCATVYVAHSRASGARFGAPAAVKLARECGSKADLALYDEMRLLVRAQGHPNVIQFLGLFRVADMHGRVGEQWALALELCAGGDLQQLVCAKGAQSESAAALVMLGILPALAHIHERGIVHRDVKSENILLAEGGRPVLTDFGVAALVSDEEAMSKRCGSAGYVAPEVLKSGVKYDTKVDVFGLGVTLYYLLCGSLPFPGKDVAQVLRRNVRCHISIENNRAFIEVGAWAKDLLSQLLNADPLIRPSAEDALTHTWLVSARMKFGGASPSAEPTRLSAQQVAEPTSPVPPTPPPRPPGQKGPAPRRRAAPERPPPLAASDTDAEPRSPGLAVTAVPEDEAAANPLDWVPLRQSRERGQIGSRRTLKAGVPLPAPNIEIQESSASQRGRWFRLLGGREAFGGNLGVGRGSREDLDQPESVGEGWESLGAFTNASGIETPRASRANSHAWDRPTRDSVERPTFESGAGVQSSGGSFINRVSFGTPRNTPRRALGERDEDRDSREILATQSEPKKEAPEVERTSYFERMWKQCKGTERSKDELPRMESAESDRSGGGRPRAVRRRPPPPPPLVTTPGIKPPLLPHGSCSSAASSTTAGTGGSGDSDAIAMAGDDDRQDASEAPAAPGLSCRDVQSAPPARRTFARSTSRTSQSSRRGHPDDVGPEESEERDDPYGHDHPETRSSRALRALASRISFGSGR